MSCIHLIFTFFFFNDTATTEIYTLSLHDALPICIAHRQAQEFTESQNKLREAEQLARASHPLLLGEVLNARGALEVDQGKFQAGEATFEHALTLTREQGDHDGEASVRNNLARVAMSQRRFGEAVDRGNLALQLSRSLGLQPLTRSEEHTSELQSQSNLVCRLLLEKK